MADSDRERAKPRIVAPVCGVDELLDAADRGAGEVYCGIIPPELGDLFGFDDIINRRQGRAANLSSLASLGALASKAQKLNMPAALALNCQYSRPLRPHISDMASFWADHGGTALIVTDVALLLTLQKKQLPLRYHLSLMANVFNPATVAFFSGLGIDRIILPRELSFNQVSRITARFPALEFEILVLHDRCPFLDGLCGFYHSTAFLPNTATSCPWSWSQETGERCVYSSNLSYAGHGCDLVLQDPGQRHVQFITEGPHHLAPECAACQLPMITDAGVGYLKLAGRGLPSPQKADSVAFIKKAVDLWAGARDAAENRRRIRTLYAQLFGQPCCKSQCYYQARIGE